VGAIHHSCLVDDILLASSRVELFIEIKFMLNSHFDMMDLWLCCSRHSVFCYRSRGILELSQRGYIDKVLKV